MDELIERAHRGEATDAELATLQAWRSSDEGNERQYRHVVRLLEAAASLRVELTGAPPPPPAADIIARYSRTTGLGPRETAGSSTAVRSRRPPAAWRRRAPWAVAAAAAILLMINVLHPLVRAPGAVAANVVTGAGEIVTVQLDDGSVIRLAPSSRLRLGENGDPRTVSLEGRAFFAVSHVEGQPFRVLTRAATATVLGTRFDLEAGREDLRLVVVDGRVALEAPDNRVEVGAGEASAVAGRIATAPSRIEDMDEVLRWTGKFLAFRSTPLADAAREIAATYDVHVTITDRTLAGQTITAVFTGHSLEAVLDVVCSIVNARCVIDADDVTISPR